MALSDGSSLMAAGAAERLVVHLQTLSQVLETLTYRLLEMEERLTAHEHAVLVLREDLTAAGFSEETEQRLEDTEKRLVNLESLLSGIGFRDRSSRVLEAVRRDHPIDPSFEQPFMEEPEQLFMDDMPTLEIDTIDGQEAAIDPFDEQRLSA